MDKETEDALKAIPDDLKNQFVPGLKRQWRKFADLSQAFNAASKAGKDPMADPEILKGREEFLESMDQMVDHFTQAGGTENQWNILARAVLHGHLGPY